MINLAFVAGLVLAVGVLVLAVGLIRGRGHPGRVAAAGAAEDR
jgi:hypothetical protein